jgi:large subunit ribosomal protein L18
VYNRVDRKQALARRHMRIRKAVVGTPQRPRLCVFRSHAHICAQIVDDTVGRTLVSVSTVEPEIRAAVGYGGNTEAAKYAGRVAAQRALDKGISQVVFDRGGNIYHGRVAALAEAAREAGLQF